MDLPIDDKDLNVIVESLRLSENSELHERLKLTKKLKDQGLPYKKILREQYGIVA